MNEDAVVRRAALLSLVLVAGGLMLPSAPDTRARAQGASAAAPAPADSRRTEAIASATLILKALRDGDANARYNQFSDALKRISSPSMVAATMRQQPRLIRWTILAVQPGLSTTAVDVNLQTTAGRRRLQMVLTKDGKLAGYHLDRADQPATAVALAFMKAITTGNFITASSFLSPTLAGDLTPAVLQERWQTLQRETGQYVATEGAVMAESTSEQKLVLVSTHFNRLTDQVFVILDTNNRIIGLDFPNDAAPKPVAR